MKKSKLQFKNPRLRKLEFEINPNFNNENLLGLDLNSKVSIDRTNNKAIVSLLLNRKLRGCTIFYRHRNEWRI